MAEQVEMKDLEIEELQLEKETILEEKQLAEI